VECIELVQPAAMVVKPGESFSIACVECIELIQPAAMVVKPGESFSIACKITGYSAIGGGYTNWIRQSAGKAPEWIGWFYSSSETGTKDSLKSKISFTADSSSNSCVTTVRFGDDTDAPIHVLFSGVQCDDLTQPAALSVQPGQSVTISCKVSYSLSSYGTGWIRQPAGKALEWVAYVSTGGSLYYKDSLKSKFTASRETSSNTVSLRGQNLQPEDTAVYYCARNPQLFMLTGGVYKNPLDKVHDASVE
ncbi:hypothetical protein NFI96_032344, partial [Prochilodus magdalenae]